MVGVLSIGQFKVALQHAVAALAAAARVVLLFSWHRCICPSWHMPVYRRSRFRFETDMLIDTSAAAQRAEAAEAAMADQEQVGFAGDAVAARLSRSFPLASVVGMDDIKEALLLGAVCGAAPCSAALPACCPHVHAHTADLNEVERTGQGITVTTGGARLPTLARSWLHMYWHATCACIVKI
jgi:hypothetical protein